jgi:HSP20 family molecular chaperone IbpA
MVFTLLALLLTPTMGFLVGRAPYSRHSSRRMNSVVAFEGASLDDTFSRVARQIEGLMDEALNETALSLAPHGAETNDIVAPRGLLSLERSPLLALDSLLQPLAQVSGELSIEENADSYRVTMSAPGAENGDVTVTAEAGVLTVIGEATRTEGLSTFRSSFSRSVSLPRDADTTVVSTTYNDEGVVVVLPKRIASSRGASLNGAQHTQADDEIAEIEALAQESPRMARWLKAHGYLDWQSPTAEEGASDEEADWE